MAYITKFDGQTDKTIQLGDKKNPTKASIEGYYLGTKETPDTGFGPGKLHIFQTKTGTVGVWGKTNSNRLMTAELRGQMCLLTFTGMGEAKKGRNAAYNYTLKHDPENTVSVADVDVNADTAVDDDSSEGSDFEEADLGAEEAYEEVPPARPVAPKRPVTAPDAARAAKVQALLAQGRKTG